MSASLIRLRQQASLALLLLLMGAGIGLSAAHQAPPQDPQPHPVAQRTRPAAPMAPGQQLTARVLRVVDGHTIQVNLDGARELVRYIGITTPETKPPTTGVEPFGKEATEANRHLVEGKTVKLELDVQLLDQDGRILAYVYVAQLFVNAELVRQGYAHVRTVPPNVKYQPLFLQLEREARETKRGLWGER